MLKRVETKGIAELKEAGGPKPVYVNSYGYVESVNNLWGGSGDPFEQAMPPGGDLKTTVNVSVEDPITIRDGAPKDIEISGPSGNALPGGMPREKPYYTQGIDDIIPEHESNQDLVPAGMAPSNNPIDDADAFIRVRSASMSRLKMARRAVELSLMTGQDSFGRNKRAFFGGDEIIFSREAASAEKLSRVSDSPLWDLQVGDDGDVKIARLFDADGVVQG